MAKNVKKVSLALVEKSVRLVDQLIAYRIRAYQWYWQNIRVVRISVARALHFSVLFLDSRRAGVVARTRQVARGPRGLEPYGAPGIPSQRPGHGPGGTRERRDPRPACTHGHTTLQLSMVRFSPYFRPAEQI